VTVSSRRTLAIILLVMSVLGVGGAAGAQEPAAPPEGVQEVDCAEAFGEAPGLLAIGGLVCGRVDVPVDAADPAAGTLQLGVAILPAFGLRPLEDPLFVLAGGPGQSAVAFARELTSGPSLELLTSRRRDVILLEQRGIGASVPDLDCPEVDDLQLTGSESGEEAAALQIAAHRACHTRLVGQGVDLSAFDSIAVARDIEAVRTTLGYGPINLLGTSYGTTVAMEYVRAHPGSLRSVILSSPVAPEANSYEDLPLSFQGALTAVFDACAADPACAAAYPDLPAAADAANAELTANPGEIPVTDPATGEPAEPLVFDAAAFSSVLYQMLFGGDVADIPLAITLVANGQVDQLLGLAADQAGKQDGDGEGVELRDEQPVLDPSDIAEGMGRSVDCAEESAYGDLAQHAANRAAVSPLVGEHENFLSDFLGPICAFWGVDPVDPVRFEPVVSEVPILVVSGSFDPITPPVYGDVIAASNTNTTHVVATALGHSPLDGLGRCGLRLVRQFLREPLTELDPSCAEQGVAFNIGEVTEPEPEPTAAPTPAPEPTAEPTAEPSPSPSPVAAPVVLPSPTATAAPQPALAATGLATPWLAAAALVALAGGGLLLARTRPRPAAVRPGRD